MLGAPSMHTLARLDQLSFLLKNMRSAFRTSSPLVWPRSGSKHNISSLKGFSFGILTQTHSHATSVTSVLSSTVPLTDLQPLVIHIFVSVFYPPVVKLNNFKFITGRPTGGQCLVNLSLDPPVAPPLNKESTLIMKNKSIEKYYHKVMQIVFLWLKISKLLTPSLVYLYWGFCLFFLGHMYPSKKTAVHSLVPPLKLVCQCHQILAPFTAIKPLNPPLSALVMLWGPIWINHHTTAYFCVPLCYCPCCTAEGHQNWQHYSLV